MKPVWLAAVLGVIGISICFWFAQPNARAQSGARVQWIWFDEGDPAQNAPAGTRYFRRVFPLQGLIEPPVDEAFLDVAADSAFTVWVNGTAIGKGDNPKRVYAFDVRKHLLRGKNVIAVEAVAKGGPAGLLVRLGYVPNGQSKISMTSDGAWRASKSAGDGWKNVGFDDSGWHAVRVIGPYNEAGPWKNLVWDQGGDDRFSVPAGFRVEQAVRPPDGDKTFSLVNMTFDNKGRLLVSREGGPILLCTEPDKNGVLQKVQPYCEQVKNCQGMCWVKDALLLVGNGPKGAGLYRVKDTNGDDQTDEATLLHQFNGGMGEHGPHAIIHGPDDWLYVVTGNHAWAHIGKKAAPNPAKLAGNSPLTRWPSGGMGPDQGKPHTTEDVLLPRLNDSRGHAANILAPGGTIWRLDHQGQNMSLVAAGFRNHFDAAFSPAGELFTFDSDMEWDENLPWYRAVRVCHCPPGADFVWRTGAANTPDYYIDSLPPTAETGRGSPVGLEFYDHHAFPEKYQGAYFMADWAIGTIFAVGLQREGASYRAKVERFCSGAPMNVTDLCVSPDGAMYFTMGGRGTLGGVYRIIHGNGQKSPRPEDVVSQLLSQPQPLAAWSRAFFQEVRRKDDLPGSKGVGPALLQAALDESLTSQKRIRALDLLQNYWQLSAKNLLSLTEDKNPDLRAHALWLLGANGYKDGRDVIVTSLKDGDAMVRRRACDALIRAGFEPPVDKLWPLLADKDRFVRHAARLVLERINPALWIDRLGKEVNDLIAWNGIIALCHADKANPFAEQVFGRLHGSVANNPKEKDFQPLLDYLRTVQMALIHVTGRPIWTQAIAKQCWALFPHKDWRVNRELAILLAQLQREGQLQHAQDKLVPAILKAKDDRLQQIHYFYCLRLLKDGWSPEQKSAILAWYDGTRTWQGGHSFTPFLENIFKESLDAYSVDDYKKVLANGEETPLPTLVMAQRLQTSYHPELLPELDALAGRLAKSAPAYRGAELRQAVEDALTRTSLQKPSAASWPYLVRGLATKNQLVIFNSIKALRELKIKPKVDDPAPYRNLLVAAQNLNEPKSKWQAVELLRHWTGRTFGAETGQWKGELELWARWFNQSFPKEAPLPTQIVEQPAQSKYKMADLLNYLEKDPAARKADPARGKLVFEKAQCAKCHKFGKLGEGVGPDLTTLSKRFKRADVLESILFPSKVISDQYRSVTITTQNGQTINGLAAAEGDTVSVLLNDATKVTLKKSEIDSQVASLISVMPERLLDPLSRAEIADLFAYLESDPK